MRTAMLRAQGTLAAACLCGLLAGYPMAAGATESVPREATIVVGAVSGNPQKIFPKLEVLANYLAAKLADRGIRKGDAVVAANNTEMIELLRSGAVDVLSETAFSAVHFERGAGAEILLREWKRGVSEYRGLLVARADSGIDAVEDLVGKVIAFEDPGSTTAFLLPLALMRTRGLKLAEVAPGQKPAPDAVGYVISSDEVSIAAMVERGIADAGALSDQDWVDPEKTPEAMKASLVVFHTSEPLPRSTFLARGDLEAELKEAIRDILLKSHEDAEGAEAIKAYNGVKQYDAFEGEAAAALDGVREFFPLVEPEIR